MPTLGFAARTRPQVQSGKCLEEDLMKVAYASTYDPTDPKAIDGRGYYMAQSLGKQLSLQYVGPLSNKRYFFAIRVKRGFYRRVGKKKYTPERDRLLIKDYARQISAKLTRLNADIILSPMSPGSQPIAYLECEQPIVIWTDTTLAGAMDIYPGLSRSTLCRETIRDGLANEQAALTNSSLAIYSSEWAAQTAINNYQIDAAKVKVVPFGANIECDRTFDDIKAIVDSRPLNKCKLLFFGIDWYRKGGDVAFQIAKELNRAGLDTELTIVGCNPPIPAPRPDFVELVGYISKSTQAGTNQINRLLAEAHFLILPTRADCTPTVFNEACSFGLPCVSSNVGGISTIIRDGLNGKTFSRSADVSDYCTYISEMFSDYSRYRNLALSSCGEYQSRLNWSVAAVKVKKLLEEVVS